MTVTRRAAAVGALAALAAPAIVRAQATKRVMMVLWRGETEVEQGFRAHVQERGLPFELIVRDVDRSQERIDAAREEARRMRPDLVYTWGTAITLGMVGTFDGPERRDRLADLPVVFALVADPVGARIVRAIGPSGRNVTGVSHSVPLNVQLDAIAGYRPFQRLAVIYNPQEQASRLNVEALGAAAQERGFQLIARAVPLDAQNEPIPDTVAGLVDAVADAGADFLYIGPDVFIGDKRIQVTAQALKRRLPTFTSLELTMRRSACLFGVVTRYETVGRYAARKAEQILARGQSPAEIPVETLQRFSYVVNIDVARQLELYPPMSVMAYAELIGV